MKTDPDYFDPKIAGWWVWGQSAWISRGWCEVRETGVHRQRPQLSTSAGVHRQRPHLSATGMGVHRKRPHLSDNGRGVHAPTRGTIYAYMRALAVRMRDVRVCCGDWSRVLGDNVTFNGHGLTGVFLDPPYSAEANRKEHIYAVEDLTVAHDAAKWAIANGTNPQMRVALCGYESEHAMPQDWECVSWKTEGGYARISDNSHGRLNSYRERIWFSPHCLKADLFRQNA